MLVINTVGCAGGAGRVCSEMAEQFAIEGKEVVVASRDGAAPIDGVHWKSRRIGTWLGVHLHGLMTRFFDVHGTGVCSWFATRRFIKWAEEFSPDVVWLHNVHGYYLNYPMLFRWFKSRSQMPVHWILHDFWPITGHCVYFSMAGCDGWRTGCKDHCPQKRVYPGSMVFSRSRLNLERKADVFREVPNLHLYVPSEWMKGLVQQSFLGCYPIEVRRNDVDRSVFRPRPSDFKSRFGIDGKKVVLGVASVWEERKGLADFVELAHYLDDRFVIVLIGQNRTRIRDFPANVIWIERTSSRIELAEIYTAADFFFNPSREETFGMVNLEAAYCGARVIVYGVTAMPESVRGLDNAVVLSSLTPQACYSYIVSCVSGKGE